MLTFTKDSKRFHNVWQTRCHFGIKKNPNKLSLTLKPLTMWIMVMMITSFAKQHQFVDPNKD